MGVKNDSYSHNQILANQPQQKINTCTYLADVPLIRILHQMPLLCRSHKYGFRWGNLRTTNFVWFKCHTTGSAVEKDREPDVIDSKHSIADCIYPYLSSNLTKSFRAPARSCESPIGLLEVSSDTLRTYQDTAKNISMTWKAHITLMAESSRLLSMRSLVARYLSLKIEKPIHLYRTENSSH